MVILRTPSAYFVAPDNGVLSYIVEEACPTSAKSPERQLGPEVEAMAITNTRFWRFPISSTFHGRDILAPVAAHLSRGVPLDDFGEVASSLLSLPIPHPHRQPDGVLSGQVIHIDHFGNLVTNIRGADLPDEGVAIEIAGQRIQELSRSYEEGGELLAIVGSSGYLEVSQRNGNAAAFLCSRVGDELKVSVL